MLRWKTKIQHGKIQITRILFEMRQETYIFDKSLTKLLPPECFNAGIDYNDIVSFSSKPVESGDVIIFM